MKLCNVNAAGEWRNGMTHIGPGSTRRRMMPRSLSPILLASVFLGTFSASAAVFDVTAADVTTRAFSVVWVSDQAVTDATVKVFRDADGTDEINSDLNVTLVSSVFPPALDQGIVKVSVTGLAVGETVYFQTNTTGAGGLVEFPQTPPFPDVNLQSETTKATASNDPIVNDVFFHELFEPDGATFGAGMLWLLKAPGVSDYPLSAFVGNGFASPAAAVNANNFFDDTTNASAEIPAGVVLQSIEFRGLVCDPEEQKLVRWRRAPDHEEVNEGIPPITELEKPAACFSPDSVSADYDCDGEIGILDFARFVGQFRSQSPDCGFNADFDLDDDGTVGILDFAGFVSVFREKEE